MYKNNRTLRAVAALLTVVMALVAFCGCSAVITDPVVAKVGDVEVKYSAFYNAFSTYAQYGIIDTSDAVTLAEGRNMIMDMMVDSVVPTAQAHAEGITLTDEEKAEAEKAAEDAMANYLGSFMDETIEDEAARREAAIKGFNEAYKANDISYDSLLEEMKKEYVDNACGEKLIKELYSTIESPTDEEIKARYDKELTDDKEIYADDVNKYQIDSSNASYGSLRPLVAPEGMYYVKHILIKNEENAGEEDKGRDYKAIAKEVMDKVNAGEDFDALIEKYNEDPGMAANPDGYIFSPDLEGVYDEAFQKAGAALKAEGDVSGMVEGSYGIHIIKRMGDISTDEVPLEEVKDDIKNLILTEKQTELYKSKLETWKESLDIKTYDKRVQYVGMR